MSDIPVPPSGDVFNVRDYGATGDRVADDTAAFQAAIDACNQAAQTDGAQRRVYVPGGDYRVGALTIPEGLVMWGDGSTTTRLFARDAGQTTLSMVASTGYSGSISIRDISFNGDGRGGTGIRLEGTASDRRVHDVHIEDCLFYELDTGVSLRLTANAWLTRLHAAVCTTGFRIDTSGDVRLTNCFASNGDGWGFWISDDGLHGASGEGVYLTTCTTNVQAGGLKVEGHHWGAAIGCSFTSTDGPAVLLDGHGWRVTAPEIATARFEEPGIVLSPTSEKCVIADGYFALSKVGIVVDGRDHVVSGNILESNATTDPDIEVRGQGSLIGGNVARSPNPVSIVLRDGAAGNLVDGNLVAGDILREGAAGAGGAITATNQRRDPVTGLISRVQAAPVVTAGDQVVPAGFTVAAGALFAASDGNGDALTVSVRDETADPASGHWVLGGVAQPAGRTIALTAGGLADLAFVAGSVTDRLAVRADDGVLPASDWTTFLVAPGAAPPQLRITELVNATEASRRAELAVTLDRSAETVVTVRWRVVDGTARVADHDMPGGQAGTLTFVPGGPLSQAVVVVLNDQADLLEGTEQFAVVLEAASGADIAVPAASVRVADDYVATGPSPLLMHNSTTGEDSTPALDAYDGPLTYLSGAFVYLGGDDIVLTAAAPNVFLRGGSGDDALSARAGQNVLDGGAGSNFLVGGSGADTFFLDARDPTVAIWNTVVGFETDDAATLWGITPAHTIDWLAEAGAPGYIGLTLLATAPDRAGVALTLAGMTEADRAAGRLSVAFGTDLASGSDYMHLVRSG